MSQIPDLDLDLEQDSGPPADWKPDWNRWVRMRGNLKKLADLNKANTARIAELEGKLTAKESEATKAKTEHDKAIADLRAKLEEGEVRSIEGLVEPDPAQFRLQHQRAMADVPEAKRVSLADWTKTMVSAAQEKHDEAPRWLRGFLGAGQPPQPPPKPGDKKPPADTKRLPPPPPKGGFTPEQVEKMSPEEYKANAPAIEAQLRGETGGA